MERTGPGLPEGMEALSRQASALREALERSEENTQGMVAALGSFDSRVSAIEASIRPAQVRTQAITMAHENIDRTIENAEAILAQFDIVRRYQSTLKILFQQSETGSETESQLAVVIMKIMQALQNNLNGKSKQYKDPALSHIFLMNNLHYMVTSVRRSQAKDILGDDWIQRHGKIVQQNANQYKRVAWARILQTLTIQATGGTGSSAPSDVSSSGVSRSMIKERFKSFNAQFEELHAVQSQWTIPDQELRDNLRLAVAEVFLPAYRSFINRFGNLVQREKNPHKHIKHSPEALEQLLGQFFQGQQVGEQKH